MIDAVADTHAAIWYLHDDPRLSSLARRWMDEAAIGRHKIAVSSISLIEVVYLIDRGRVPSSAFADLQSAFADSEHVLVEVSVSGEVANAMRDVSRTQVPDMPDRIIAATGLYLEVPVISCDRRIRAANLASIW